MNAILVNGAPSAFPGGSVAELLDAIGLGPDRPGIAVARNGELVRRRDWAGTAVGAGDHIEVVTARGGG
jgi:sulfur carrier protein